jgi:ribosomal protein S12 methylthiotransferase
VLIGQDTSVWTGTIDGKHADLAGLLDALATRFADTWLRVMYLQPEGITSELLRVIREHDNICSYLDIPLQHANARILDEMNRTGSGAEYIEMLRRERKAVPGITIRTTLIAGFPGETRADAAELERFIDEADFDYAGVFPYSQEDGTPAGERPDQVPARTKKARAQRLRDHADEAGFARAEAHVGSTAQVLVCGADDEGIYGRTQGQAPDVDGVTYIDGATTVDVGSFVQVHITDSVCYDLYGELCGGDA